MAGIVGYSSLRSELAAPMMTEMRRELPRPFLPLLLCGFGALQLRQWLRQLAQRIGAGRPSSLPESALTPPDSQLAGRAEALAREAYDGHLFGHGQRTWAYAVAVSRHLGLMPDPEALYVACLLHDLGLTERFAGPDPFELRGAVAARDVCLPDAVRGDLVHEAIAMHTSLQTALGAPEMRLVQSGSGCDLVGLDHELVHPATRAAIRARWPKGERFANHVRTTLETQTAPHPHSPGAGLLRVGFAGRMRAYDARERGMP